MIRSDAKSWPPKRFIKKFHKRILEFRQRLTRHVHISDGIYDYRFRCETEREFNRCLKIFLKEIESNIINTFFYTIKIIELHNLKLF